MPLTRLKRRYAIAERSTLDMRQRGDIMAAAPPRAAERCFLLIFIFNLHHDTLAPIPRQRYHKRSSLSPRCRRASRDVVVTRQRRHSAPAHAPAHAPCVQLSRAQFMRERDMFMKERGIPCAARKAVSNAEASAKRGAKKTPHTDTRAATPPPEFFTPFCRHAAAAAARRCVYIAAMRKTRCYVTQIHYVTMPPVLIRTAPTPYADVIFSSSDTLIRHQTRGKRTKRGGVVRAQEAGACTVQARQEAKQNGSSSAARGGYQRSDAEALPDGAARFF